MLGNNIVLQNIYLCVCQSKYITNDLCWIDENMFRIDANATLQIEDHDLLLKWCLNIIIPLCSLLLPMGLSTGLKSIDRTLYMNELVYFLQSILHLDSSTKWSNRLNEKLQYNSIRHRCYTLGSSITFNYVAA